MPGALEPFDFSKGAGNTMYYGTLEHRATGLAVPAIFRGVSLRVMSGSRPVVSPDLTKLACVAQDGAHHYGRLFYTNADGSAPLPLSGPSPGVTVAPLDWLRDSSHVLLPRSQGTQNSLHP